MPGPLRHAAISIGRRRKTDGKRPAVLCPHGHWPNGRFIGDRSRSDASQMSEADSSTGAEKTAGRRPLSLAGPLRQVWPAWASSSSITTWSATPTRRPSASQRLHGRRGRTAFAKLHGPANLEQHPRPRFLSRPARRRSEAHRHHRGQRRRHADVHALAPSTIARPRHSPPSWSRPPCKAAASARTARILRVGTGNVEIAGLFAPKPLGMSGANDWTMEIETKGLPELKKLYKLYGAEDMVTAKCFPQFDAQLQPGCASSCTTGSTSILQLGVKEADRGKAVQAGADPERTIGLRHGASRPPEGCVDAGTAAENTDRSAEQADAGVTLRRRTQSGWRSSDRVVEPALAGDDRRSVAGQASEIDGERDGRRWINWTTWPVEKSFCQPQRPRGSDSVPDCPQGQEFAGTVVIWIHPDGKSSLLQGRQAGPGRPGNPGSQAATFSPGCFRRLGQWNGRPAMIWAIPSMPASFRLQSGVVAERVHDILTP